MRILSLICVAGMVALWTAPCHGQMATFPAPPPLAPPDDHASDDANKNGLSLNSTPDADDSAAGKKADAPTGNTNSTNAPIVPTATAETLSSMTALDDKIPLVAGDTISFRVIEDRDQAITRIITDTGEVDFPYIGRVKVEGQTCHQVALEVKKLLEVDYYKQATVIVGLDVIIDEDKTKPHDMAWVVGQVRDVGPQELTKAQPLTVSQIILRAGGLGEFADGRKVKLIHRDANATQSVPDLTKVKDFQIVDVESVFQGKSSVDPFVRSGDYVVVPKQWVNF